jgi:TrmH family RNA methyltransferase
MLTIHIDPSEKKHNIQEIGGATVDVSTLVPVGIHHPAIQRYFALKQHTKACSENLACIEGAWAISLALKANLEFHAFYACPELIRSETCKQLVANIIADGVPSYTVSEKVMRKLVEWEGPDGLAAIIALPHWRWEHIALRQHNRLLVLDGLENPGNIGTIIRCADGAGADALIITNRKRCLTHPKLIHASMGSLFTFPIIEASASESIAWLQRHAFKIVITDTSAALNYREANYAGRTAVVMGNERHGISPPWHEARHVSVSIPMHGRADSLNVGNAAVLMLYEVLHQQKQL